jgi:arginyl-tRNA synthetase
MASNQYLEEKLRLMQLDQKPFANCYPEQNPLDVFKTHVANAVAGIFPVDAAKVFGLLQRTKALEHGDLTLPVPALGVKGDKAELAAKLVEKACPTTHSQYRLTLTVS